ncbi:hypothetical protein LEP1GSC068_2761 [Leptospira sp. Fiocruz LV3954]|nr:hypothetical protein LEP1GSC068_2761 [Leptospira sp. Fiocruz LV3954]EMI63026.1 hypothetical protein LEP1GSC076_1346 [Leptospira sp. Fiocruz LV4135]
MKLLLWSTVQQKFVLKPETLTEIFHGKTISNRKRERIET